MLNDFGADFKLVLVEIFGANISRIFLKDVIKRTKFLSTLLLYVRIF